MSTTSQSSVHCAIHPVIVFLVEATARKDLRVSQLLDMVDAYASIPESVLDTLEDRLAAFGPKPLCLDTSSRVFQAIHKYYGVRGISG